MTQLRPALPKAVASPGAPLASGITGSDKYAVGSTQWPNRDSTPPGVAALPQLRPGANMGVARFGLLSE